MKTRNADSGQERTRTCALTKRHDPLVVELEEKLAGDLVQVHTRPGLGIYEALTTAHP